jgi:16S rRNA (uracil1498-N3)-methyltransferase
MFRFIIEKREGNIFVISPEVYKRIKAVRVLKEVFICLHNEQFDECKLISESQAVIVKKLNLNHEYSKPVILATPVINLKKLE